MSHRSPGVDLPDLGDRELDIMDAVWSAAGPVTVRDVQQALRNRGHRVAYTTVQTMLNRLQAKRLVTRNRRARIHTYASRVPRQAAIRTAVRRLVERFFDGSSGALATHLVEDALSAEDLARVRDVIESAELVDDPQPASRKP
jgi:predicted transcriptional regulator